MADVKPIVAGPSQFQQLQAGDYLVGNTPSAGDNSTRMATTAYVDAAVAGGGGGGGAGPPAFTAKNTNYTFVAGDAGAAYAVTSTASRTYTIPSGTFSAGDIIWVANLSTTSSVTIGLQRGSGLALYLAGGTTNSNKTVALGGMCIIYFITSSRAVIYGSGVG